MRLNQAIAIVVSCLLVYGVSGTPSHADDAALPNVVFILADDIGYGDVGCYGGKVPTPNIDRLAQRGMRFTDAHAPAPLCAPSRFSLLTGSYPHRNGRPGGTWNINNSIAFAANAEHTRAGRHVTVAEVLRDAGYRTAFIGKSHLGGDIHDTDGNLIRNEADIPGMDLGRGIQHELNEHGFDYVFSMASGLQHAPFAYFENGRFAPIDPDKPADNRSTRPWANGTYTVGPNGTSEIVEHPADTPGIGDIDYDSSQTGIVLTDKAVAFIDNHFRQAGDGAQRPFFLYYASQAIHVPHTPPLDFDGDPDPMDQPVAGTTGAVTSDMVRELDMQVGRIIDKLEAQGVLENTLVIFTSDNGALWPNVVQYGDPEHDNNGPFRGYKADVYEGGHRVPMIVAWGDGTDAGSRIKPGSVRDLLVLAQDWAASMYDLTGRPMSPDQAMDSTTILPVLFGQHPDGQPVHEFGIYQAGYAFDGAIREGDMVLLVDHDNKATELYDLSTDLEQAHNLIDDERHADLVTRLRDKFLTYNDHLAETLDEPRTTTVFDPAHKTPIPRLSADTSESGR